MAKITIDIETIKKGLENIGYIISDLNEKENNGTNWQFKFANSGAVATVYDSNKMKNTVVNGKCDDEEKRNLKEIIDGLKCKELEIDDLNLVVTNLIKSKKEEDFYDFKKEWASDGKQGDLLHDILCLSNNMKHIDAYLMLFSTLNDASFFTLNDAKVA